MALPVTGRMVAAVDHFGWLGLARRHLGDPRRVGGAILIRR